MLQETVCIWSSLLSEVWIYLYQLLASALCAVVEHSIAVNGGSLIL